MTDNLEKARKLMAQAGARHAEQQSQMAEDLLKMFPASLGWTKNDVMRRLDDEYHKSLEKEIWK